MKNPAKLDIAEVLEELRAQMADLSQRLSKLEATSAAAPAPAAEKAAAPAPAKPPAEKPAAAPAPDAPGITEEEILAVSAALAAYFGVRMRIRSIRLMGSPVWAQQGRVSIQASHRLHN